jgi:hypothetical protein
MAVLTFDERTDVPERVADMWLLDLEHLGAEQRHQERRVIPGQEILERHDGDPR